VTTDWSGGWHAEGRAAGPGEERSVILPWLTQVGLQLGGYAPPRGSVAMLHSNIAPFGVPL
jgi:hypothetical protein